MIAHVMSHKVDLCIHFKGDSVLKIMFHVNLEMYEDVTNRKIKVLRKKKISLEKKKNWSLT